jgi:hypothetical protein
MERIITNNEVLFTCKLNLDRSDILALYKQSYSDRTCFYTLQDARGIWKIDYGSKKVSNLIKQIKREIKIDSSVEKQDFYKENIKIQQIYDEVKRWKQDVLNNLQKIS